MGVSTSRAPISADVLDDVAQVEGVDAVEGAVSGYALLTDNDGQAIIPSGGAPTMGYSMPADERLRGDVALLSGSAPDAPTEVAIDATSAEENNVELGSTIKVLFQGPTQEFTVVGTVGFGGEKDLGGTTSAYFDTATAQQVVGEAGYFDTIDVSAADGVSQAELTERIAAVLPQGHRGSDRGNGVRGERRRCQGRPQDGDRHVHDLRRHRTVRRVHSSSGTRSR
jgi:putative ABC transport system permease protein